VIAAVKDPVAIDCISKLAQNATSDTVVGTSQQLIEDAVAPGPMPLPKVEDLPCPTLQDFPTITPLTAVNVTSPSNHNIEVLRHGIGASCPQTSISSDIPLLFASHDLSLPVITLPLVACSMTSTADMPSVDAEKSFVTVAAVGDLSSLSENVIITPAYRPV